MASLTLVEGPVAAGKTAIIKQMLADGEIQIMCEYTGLWAVLRGKVRGADGKYPVRLRDDPFNAIGTQVKRFVIAEALKAGLDCAVSSSVANQADEWRRVAEQHGADFSVRRIDPGRHEIEVILRDEVTGQIDPECSRAMSRWYNTLARKGRR